MGSSIFIQCITRPAYGLIRKGTEMVITANTGRQRTKPDVAHNFKDHSVIIQETGRINAESTVRLLNEMLRKQTRE